MPLLSATAIVLRREMNISLAIKNKSFIQTHDLIHSVKWKERQTMEVLRTIVVLKKSKAQDWIMVILNFLHRGIRKEKAE